MRLLCLFPVSLIVCLPHPGCLLLFRTLELYFCGSSGSPASLFLPLISLSSCLSPSIAPCQVLCPSCLCVVYIWWVTFLNVTAPFSPRGVSGVFSVSPPPWEKLPGRFCSFWLCLLCLFCVIAPVIINNWQSFFFSIYIFCLCSDQFFWSQSKWIHFRSVWSIFFCAVKSFYFIFFIACIYQCARCFDWRAQTVYPLQIMYFINK